MWTRVDRYHGSSEYSVSTVIKFTSPCHCHDLRPPFSRAAVIDKKSFIIPPPGKRKVDNRLKQRFLTTYEWSTDSHKIHQHICSIEALHTSGKTLRTELEWWRFCGINYKATKFAVLIFTGPWKPRFLHWTIHTSKEKHNYCNSKISEFLRVATDHGQQLFAAAVSIMTLIPHSFESSLMALL